MTDGAAEAILPDAERIPQVAALKRVFELWAMDRGFHDAYLADSARALAATGLDVDPEAVRTVLLRTLPEGAAGWDDADRLPETFTWYREYVEGRARGNVLARTRELPVEPRFRD